MNTQQHVGQMCLLCTAVWPQPVITVAGSGSVHVPLEDVLQLAQGLMAYLQQHNPVAEPSSPPRKQQARGQQLAPANAGVVPTPVQMHAVMYVCMHVCMHVYMYACQQKRLEYKNTLLLIWHSFGCI